MSEFRTTIKLGESPIKISHQKPIFLIGSCFSESIGYKLLDSYFSATLNPFGILFNPLSIAASLERLLSKREFEVKELFKYQDLWISWMHHGRFDDSDLERGLDYMNSSFYDGVAGLESAETLIITWGSSYAYFLTKNTDTPQLVANCHKLPASYFIRKRIEIEEIVTTYADLLAEMWKTNPNLKVILTVSPIRHLRDGLHENQLSKAILLLAAEELCKMFPKQFSYFPSYEIMMDDLRDYRFYRKDMLHPSSTAVDYVWDLFSKTYFTEETLQIAKDCSKLTFMLEHNALHSNTEASRKFEQAKIDKRKELKKQYPYLNL
ncbi:MAG: GSCFA domain-containing protein [Bacteroidaceae bacterium]